MKEDPVSLVIRGLYSGGGVFLDEAERQVAEAIEVVESGGLDRSAPCVDREDLEKLASLVEELPRAPEPVRERVSQALAAILRVMAARCEPEWASLSAAEKARVLTPLYMALYHLEAYQGTRDAHHVEAAESLALLALARLEELEA